MTFDIPPQEIITRDSVTVSVDAVCYFRTFNAVDSILKVENAHYATHLLAATTLRNALAQLSLQEILLDKDSITREIQEALDDATQTW